MRLVDDCETPVSAFLKLRDGSPASCWSRPSRAASAATRSWASGPRETLRWTLDSPRRSLRGGTRACRAAPAGTHGGWPATISRRGGRRLRLRPGSQRRATWRAQPGPAGASRHGADGLRADARVRSSAARALDHRLRLLRRGRRRRGRLRPRGGARSTRLARPCESPSRSRRPGRAPTCAGSRGGRSRRSVRVEPHPRAVRSQRRPDHRVRQGRRRLPGRPLATLQRAAPVDAFSIYRGLRAINPSPYMYFLDLGDFELAGASPEPLLKVSGRRVEMRPIAGTYPRGRTARRGPRPGAAAPRRHQREGRASDARRPLAQ